MENVKVVEAVDKYREDRNAKAVLIKEDGDCMAVKTGSALSEALYKKENVEFKYIFVNGALSDGFLKPILISNVPMKGRTIIVSDSSKILLSASVYEKIGIKGASLCVIDPIHLAALTINPFSAYGYDFDKDEFMEKMSARVNIPVINVEDRATYEKLIDLCADEKDVIDVLRFLREREVVHFQRFGEALRGVQDKLAEKKFYMNDMRPYDNKCGC